jgi:hypothetical protein
MFVPAGIPQGTKIGPWLFLAMINDLNIGGLPAEMWKLAEVVKKDGVSELQETVHEISEWTNLNRFQLNPTKCKEMIISFKKQPCIYTPLNVNNQSFEVVNAAKLLGVTITQDLKWNTHVENIVRKAAKRIYLLRQLKRADVDSKSLIRFYCSCIRSVLEYACQAFHTSLPQYLSNAHIQKRALRIIYQDLSYTGNLKREELETLHDRLCCVISCFQMLLRIHNINWLNCYQPTE